MTQQGLAAPVGLRPLEVALDDSWNERVGLRRFEFVDQSVEACVFRNKVFVRTERPPRRPSEKLKEHPDADTAREAWERLVRRLVVDGFVEVECPPAEHSLRIVMEGPRPEDRHEYRVVGANVFVTFGQESAPSRGPRTLMLWSHEAALDEVRRNVDASRARGYVVTAEHAEAITTQNTRVGRSARRPIPAIERLPETRLEGLELARALANEGDARGLFALALLSDQPTDELRGQVFRGFEASIGQSIVLEFRHGFAFHATFRSSAPSNAPLAELLGAFCALPVAQTIRSVTLGEADQTPAEHSLGAPLKALVTSPIGPSLTALRLEPIDRNGRVLHVGDVSRLWKGLPSLESLSATFQEEWPSARPSKLGNVKHPSLRSLRLKIRRRTEVLPLTRMHLPQLTTLHLDIDRGADDEISLDDVDRVLAHAESLPLENVTFEGWFIPHVLEVLPEHAWIRRLQRLSLVADSGLGTPTELPALEQAISILEMIPSVAIRDDVSGELIWPGP
ncbi:MAG: hypothetical protein Q8L14_39900 [Myxococcales bacterium]|nr:hypothetical protein [Myxococcales bacterium]